MSVVIEPDRLEFEFKWMGLTNRNDPPTCNFTTERDRDDPAEHTRSCERGGPLREAS